MKSLSRGPSPIITVKMPQGLIAEMDHARALLGMSRSRFLRMAVAQAATVARLNVAKLRRIADEWEAGAQ